MYRESRGGGKSQYSHDREETLVRSTDPQRRWISDWERGLSDELFIKPHANYINACKLYIDNQKIILKNLSKSDIAWFKLLS